MKINDVCNETGLTKKAVSYYENQGLINPEKSSNGYRNYTSEDIGLLKEVFLYRKLDISIKDIKNIIETANKNSILSDLLNDKKKQQLKIERQEKYLKILCESEFSPDLISDISSKISEEENLRGEYIKNELKRVFPNGLGAFLSFHFAAYLNEPIDTPEKINAWRNIVDFLDNIQDIKFPKEVSSLYDSISDTDIASFHNLSNEKFTELLNADEEKLEKYKKEISDYVERKDENKLLDKMEPFNKYKKAMAEFFKTSGYYDTFIPNLKVLSKSYKEYQEKLTALNEGLCFNLKIKYDADMNIVKEE
ncbi:MAG: MerR family transcriptional regulator [Clostridiaceae bacterium]